MRLVSIVAIICLFGVLGCTTTPEGYTDTWTPDRPIFERQASE